MSWPGFHDPDQETREQYLVRAMQWLLPIVTRLEQKDDKLMSALTDLQASWNSFYAAFTAYRKTVDTAVADAIAADEAGEDSALADMKATIDAATASLPPQPVPPPTSPPPAA